MTELADHVSVLPLPSDSLSMPSIKAKVARLRPPRSRTGALWISLVTFAVVLLLLMIFILQNLQRTSVHFLGAQGHWPIGAALLLSAVFGMLLVAVPTAARIMQLRMLAARRLAPPATTTIEPTAAMAEPVAQPVEA